MTDREIDALLHGLLYNIPVSWRVCARDPECGEWEDVQRHVEQRQEGEIVWLHPAERHPCYNWLDTDEPKQHGWTDAQIAEARSDDTRWYVVPFYRTDIAAAWRVIDRMRTLGFYLELRGWVRSGDFMATFTQPGGRAFCVTDDTAPMAIRRAALKALGVDNA